MEVLDTSIANVALPHIAGSLSVSVHESTWVLTSYLVANAVILPLTGWLSSIIGRKRFYLTCVVLFTISSALCGMATSIEQLVFFRVLQGLAGGGLQPSEQAILMDTFPPARRGMAMAVYTLAILVAPVLGPTLGGYITENYSWRWIFYINLPVGLISVFLSSMLLEDPPYLKAQRAARKGQPFRIDFIGLSLLSIGLASLELMLDKGQEHDWFDSPFIVRLAVVAAVSLVAVVVWELRHPAPIINLRLFRDRNFTAASVCVFCAFGVLYGSNVLLPQMLQTLMGYSALNAGLVLSPAGFVTMLEMPVIGILLSRGVRRAEDDRRRPPDRRPSPRSGCRGSTWAYRPGMVISPRNFQTLGAGLMFVPLNLAAYAFIPKDQTNNASGLFSLVRNEGSSIGVALTNTLLQRRTQFHQFRMTEHINPLNPLASRWLSGHLGVVPGPRLRPGRGPAAGAADDVPGRPAAGGGGVVPRHVLAVRHALVRRDPAGVPDEAVDVRRGQPRGPLNECPSNSTDYGTQRD